MMMAMTVTVMMIMIVYKTFVTAMGRAYTDTLCFAWVASKSNTLGLRGLRGCWAAAGICWTLDEQGGDGDPTGKKNC